MSKHAAVHLCVWGSVSTLPHGQHRLWVLSERYHQTTQEATERKHAQEFKRDINGLTKGPNLKESGALGPWPVSVPASGCPRPSVGPQLGPRRIQGLELGGGCSHPKQAHAKVHPGTHRGLEGPRGRQHDLLHCQLHVALGPLSGVTTTSRALGVAGTGLINMRSANDR